MKEHMKEERAALVRFRKAIAADNFLLDEFHGWVFFTDVRLKKKSWQIRFIYFNEAALHDLGYEQEEFNLSGQRFPGKIIHPKDKDKLIQILTDCREMDLDVHHSIIRFKPRSCRNHIYLLVCTEIDHTDNKGSMFTLNHTGIVLKNQHIKTMPVEALMQQFNQVLNPYSDVEFTKRELEIMSLYAQGKSRKEISEIIYRSEATVKTHINHVLQKLGMKKASEAIYELSKRGLI
jgi:DNA-binding CsgD family transcriptional regulator